MRDIDFTTLSDSDVKQILLQRTQYLTALPLLGSPSYRAWLMNWHGPLKLEAKLRRNSILHAYKTELAREAAEIIAAIGARKVSSVSDIGCGHAIIQVFLKEAWNHTAHLVDIEESDSTHHGFHSSGSGYSSLASAKALLCANGFKDNEVILTNPQVDRSAFDDDGFDVIMSLLSAGFHYPLTEYVPAIQKTVDAGGVAIFDCRDGAEQRQILDGIGKVVVIKKSQKHARVMVTSA